jgi:hypothetical protein
MLEAIEASPDTLHQSWIKGLTKDDKIWFQSIVTALSNGNRLHLGLPYCDQFLWKMIQMGYTDGRPEDRPWDASTRAMRYGAILGDRIQSNVEIERKRVSVDSLLMLTSNLSLVLLRGIAWKPRLRP